MMSPLTGGPQILGRVTGPGAAPVMRSSTGTEFGPAGARYLNADCPVVTSKGGKSACGAGLAYAAQLPPADAKDYVALLRKRNDYLEIGAGRDIGLEDLQLDDLLIWTSYGSGKMGKKYGHAAIVCMRKGQRMMVSIMNGRKSIQAITVGGAHVFRRVGR